LQLNVPLPLTLTPLGPDRENQLLGREHEIEKILYNCQVGRLTVVTSPPGMGGSSLIRAGVEPALRRAGYTTVVHSDWQGKSVAKQLRDAIVRAVHEQADGGFIATPESLLDLLTHAELKTGKTVAVLLDQFEDYVRCHTGTEVADDFDAELANAISTRSGRFVIGLQTPSVSAFERLSQYIPNLMGFAIQVPPISIDAAKQMVNGAAAQAELTIEPVAVDMLVASTVASVDAGVHPLFLKLGAERLFDAEFVLKSKVARASTLIANGGVDRLILEAVDPVVAQLGTTHTELFFRWIPLLMSKEGTRLAASEKALTEHAGKYHRFVKTLLPMLTKSGLMRSLATSAGVRYEFARESTSLVIKDWWSRSEASIIARQRAQFRVRSLSIAAGAIILAYLIYVFVGRKP
jgi:hypothetical protein